MWILTAAFSAFFAGITAILCKCGIKKTNSNIATAIRTSVVLLMAWLIVFITGAYVTITNISVRSWVFLILSGMATGASWICYFKALSLGEVSRVAAVDKSSTIFSVLFAIILFTEERDLWWLKLIFLALILIGTYLMTDIKHHEEKTKKTWFFFALLSAIFASLTSVLAKIGIENVDSNLATAIRTCIVFVFAWSIVFICKEAHFIKDVKPKELSFLVLSGITTGTSWLCYYYAIQNGKVSVVVPIDKLSILVTVIFSYIVFKEKLSLKASFGLILLVASTVCMAIFT